MTVTHQRAPVTGRAITVTRLRHEAGALEMVSGAPDPRLEGVVLDYTGYRERSAAPMRRRELPSTGIVLIFDFGPTLRFLDAETGVLRDSHGRGFVAGLHDITVLTETVGGQSGLHATLTPLGARRLLGLPMGDLVNQVVGVDDAFGIYGRDLADALRDAPDWTARFDLLDAALLRRLSETARTHPLAAAGWRRLVESAGHVSVGALARELDCSRKHLADLFRDQIGLTPKSVARILRFQHAIALYDRGACAGWADIAYACGYTDQAHFVNDFRRFSGVSPTKFLARRRPAERATLAE